MPESCPDCAASFPDPASLVAHVKKAHAGGDPKSSLDLNPESRTPGVVCALCGRRFWTPDALARHAQVPHPKPGRTPSGNYSTV